MGSKKGSKNLNEARPSAPPATPMYIIYVGNHCCELNDLAIRATVVQQIAMAESILFKLVLLDGSLRHNTLK